MGAPSSCLGDVHEIMERRRRETSGALASALSRSAAAESSSARDPEVARLAQAARALGLQGAADLALCVHGKGGGGAAAAAVLVLTLRSTGDPECPFEAIDGSPSSATADPWTCASRRLEALEAAGSLSQLDFSSALAPTRPARPPVEHLRALLATAAHRLPQGGPPEMACAPQGVRVPGPTRAPYQGTPVRGPLAALLAEVGGSVQVTALVELDLSNRALASLDLVELGRACPALRRLSLEGNRLEGGTGLSGGWAPLAALEELNLARNGLSGARPLAGLQALVNLRRLVLDQNPIQSLPAGLEHCTALRHLHAAQCDLQPGALAALRSLRSLEHCALAGNPLRSIEGLAGLTSLTYLDVSRCGLTTLRPLAALPLLHTLLAASNALTALPHDVPAPLLRELRLSGNRIGHAGPWPLWPHLEALHLQDNEIASIDPLVGLVSLRRLNLSFNAIFDFPRTVRALAPATALQVLQLNDNPVAAAPGFREHALEALPGLAELDNDRANGAGAAAVLLQHPRTAEAATDGGRWVPADPAAALAAAVARTPGGTDHAVSWDLSALASRVHRQRTELSRLGLGSASPHPLLRSHMEDWRRQGMSAARPLEAEQARMTSVSLYAARKQQVLAQHATKIQSAWRGLQARRRALRDRAEQGLAEKARAATRIQAMYRGYVARRAGRLEDLRAQRLAQQQGGSADRQRAALRIQAWFRGNRLRRRLAVALRAARDGLSSDDSVDYDEGVPDDFLGPEPDVGEIDLVRCIAAAHSKFTTTVSAAHAADGAGRAGRSLTASAPPPAASPLPTLASLFPGRRLGELGGTNPAMERTDMVMEPQATPASVSSALEGSAASPTHARPSAASDVGDRRLAADQRHRDKLDKLMREWGFLDYQTAEVFYRAQQKQLRGKRHQEQAATLRDPQKRLDRLKHALDSNPPLAVASAQSPPQHPRARDRARGPALPLQRGLVLASDLPPEPSPASSPRRRAKDNAPAIQHWLQQRTPARDSVELTPLAVRTRTRIGSPAAALEMGVLAIGLGPGERAPGNIGGIAPAAGSFRSYAHHGRPPSARSEASDAASSVFEILLPENEPPRPQEPRVSSSSASAALSLRTPLPALTAAAAPPSAAWPREGPPRPAPTRSLPVHVDVRGTTRAGHSPAPVSAPPGEGLPHGRPMELGERSAGTSAAASLHALLNQTSSGTGAASAAGTGTAATGTHHVHGARHGGAALAPTPTSLDGHARRMRPPETSPAPAAGIASKPKVQSAISLLFPKGF